MWELQLDPIKNAHTCSPPSSAGHAGMSSEAGVTDRAHPKSWEQNKDQGNASISTQIPVGMHDMMSTLPAHIEVHRMHAHPSIARG